MIQTIKQIIYCFGMEFIVYVRVSPTCDYVLTRVRRFLQLTFMDVTTQVLLIILLESRQRLSVICFVCVTERQMSRKVLYQFPGFVHIVIWSFSNFDILRSFIFTLLLILHQTFLHYYLLVYFTLIEEVLQVIGFIHLLNTLTIAINQHIHIGKLEISLLSHTYMSLDYVQIRLQRLMGKL